jgi:hypothetical protein
MNSLPIFQQHDAKEPPSGIIYLFPPADTSVALNVFGIGALYGFFNPLLLDRFPIGTGSSVQKVLSELHEAIILQHTRFAQREAVDT